MSRALLLNATIFLAAFLIGFAVLIPFDLIAEKAIFSRIESRTGVRVRADSIRPGFPFSLVARNVTARVKERDITIEEIRISPRAGLLRGSRMFDVTVKSSGGEIDLGVNDDHYRLEAREFDLGFLAGLLGASTWTARGAADIVGEFRGTRLLDGTGDVAIDLRNVAASGVRILGIEFPDFTLGQGMLRLKIAGGRIEIAESQSSGGNLGLGAAGGIAVSPDFANSPVSAVLSVIPSQELLGLMDPSTAALMTPIRKADGSIQIGLEGVLRAPRVAFR